MLTFILVDKESHIESRAKTGLRAIVSSCTAVQEAHKTKPNGPQEAGSSWCL